MRTLKGIKLRKAFCACLLAAMLFLVPTGPAAADEAVPYEVHWPAGWSVAQVPIPKSPSGAEWQGKRLRVVRTENGAIVAAIEYFYLLRNDKGKADLSQEFKIALDTATAKYKKESLNLAEVRELPLNTIGGLPCQAAELSVTAPQAQLKQTLILTLSPSYMHSVNFSALTGNYERFQPDFQAVLAGMKLK